MTLPEQAGSVAKAAIDGMKANPSCLAALLVLCVFATLQYFEGQRQDYRFEQRMDAVQRLLDQCFDRTNSILKDTDRL